MSSVLENDEYKDRKNLIKKFVAAYGNEQIFKFAMDKLSSVWKREATAFSLYFGYHTEPKTLKAIGEQMNISGTRVRALSDRAFRWLIHPKHRSEARKALGYPENPDD
jgi:DNA-directed RNA polymerase sigma subunit (sigma70/sigma32)